MTENIRKSLWGLRWIFLRDDERIPSTKTKEFRLVNETEDLVDIPDLNFNITDTDANFKAPTLSKSQKLTKITDIQLKNFRCVNIPVEKSYEEPPSMERRPIRSSTLKVRKLVLPPRTRPKVEKREIDSSFNRRKNYGKWYLPPRTWKRGLDKFKLSTERLKKAN